MAFKEPSRLDVLLTLLVQRTFLRSSYRGYIDRLGLRGDERVLDFGSGSGFAARYIADKPVSGNGRVTCVDVCEVWMRVAQKTLRKYPNVDFKLGEISTLDIDDGSHDVVFIHFVIHDIDQDLRPHIIEQLARNLVDGGKLHIREPLGRHGMSVETIRELMADHGLE